MPIGDDAVLSEIEKLKKASHRSWGDLRRGLEDLAYNNKAHTTKKVGASSRAFANRAIENTGLSGRDLLRWLAKNGK